MKRFHYGFAMNILFLALVCSVTYTDEKQTRPPFHWKKHILNDQADFEAAGIGDINNDGKTDIVSGSHWYEGPAFQQKHFIGSIEKQGTYYNDFANELMDADGDGDLDIISCTWFSKEIYWRENPGNTDSEWKKHSIDTPGNMETLKLVDMNADGILDILPDISSEVSWYEKPHPKQPKWTKHKVGEEGKGHGIGAGDVNLDGVIDIVSPHGWYEGKRSDKEMVWRFHAEFELGTACIPVLVYDANLDGLNDIVWGMGHDYGLFWLEQTTDNSQRSWNRHEIDKQWSQAHYTMGVDLDQDGKIELITGKRYYAHDGKDPGANDPLGIYLYQYQTDTKQWERYTIDFGTRAGFGLHPEIGDIDGDGDLDLVCPGKSGLYWFEQIVQ